MLSTEPLHTGARRTLRKLELEAYASVISAFRAQGQLTKDKKSSLQVLSKCLRISAERHRAEIRRAVNDELLSLVASSIAGTETDKAWRREGQKLSSTNPQFFSHRTLPHAPQILAATAGTNSLWVVQEVGLSPVGEESSPEKEIPPSIQNALQMIVSQNPHNNSRKSQQAVNRAVSPVPSPAPATHSSVSAKGALGNNKSPQGGTGGVANGSKSPRGGTGTKAPEAVANRVNGISGVSKGKSYSQLESLLCEESLSSNKLTPTKVEKQAPGQKLGEASSATAAAGIGKLHAPASPTAADKKSEEGRAGAAGISRAATVDVKASVLAAAGRVESRKRQLVVEASDLTPATKKPALGPQAMSQPPASKQATAAAAPPLSSPPKNNAASHKTLSSFPPRPQNSPQSRPSVAASSADVTVYVTPPPSATPKEQATPLAPTTSVDQATPATSVEHQATPLAPATSVGHQATPLTSMEHQATPLAQATSVEQVAPTTSVEQTTPLVDSTAPITSETPVADPLISDLISDTSDKAVLSLANKLGLASSLLNLDFMTFIQPAVAEETTPISEAAPSISQLGGIDTAVSGPFPMASSPPPLTPTHDMAPLPLLLTSAPNSKQPPHSHHLKEHSDSEAPLPTPSIPPPSSPPPPPPLTQVSSPLQSGPGHRPDTLTLSPAHQGTRPKDLFSSIPGASPIQPGTPVPVNPEAPLATPPIADSGSATMSSELLNMPDLTDISSLVDDAELLEGIPEDMAKSIQTLVQLDQQTWN